MYCFYSFDRSHGLQIRNTLLINVKFEAIRNAIYLYWNRICMSQRDHYSHKYCIRRLDRWNVSDILCYCKVVDIGCTFLGRKKKISKIICISNHSIDWLWNTNLKACCQTWFVAVTLIIRKLIWIATWWSILAGNAYCFSHTSWWTSGASLG